MLSHSKNTYEHYLPVYICDIQAISKLSKPMLINNFPHHQFILCTSGRGIFCSEYTIETKVTTGMVIYVDSAMLFSIRPDTADFGIKKIAFNGIYVPDFLHYFDFEHISTTTVNEHKVNDLFEKIFSELSACVSEDHMKLSILLYNLIVLIGSYQKKEIHHQMPVDEYLSFLGYKYIQENISYHDLSMNKFLKFHNISLEYMNALFMKFYNKNVEEMVYTYRMEFTKQAVFKVGNSFYENYYKECGFLSKEEFIKEFYEYTGMNVDEYIHLSWGVK